MSTALTGRRVALAEGRQLEELAALLLKEGAEPLRYPLVSILDAPDPAPVLAWLRELVAGDFSHVVFLTGEGVHRLLHAAESAGLKDDVLTALARTKTITRGPKPVRALKEAGLSPYKVAAAPTTAGVIETLKQEALAGQTVGVQLYSPENPDLIGYLQGAGATPRPVLPYVYAPAADADRVVNLLQRLAAGSVDALIFTSTPQLTRLLEVARERALAVDLAKTCVAAVGPVIADALRQAGFRVDVVPEQGFVMKNLVQQLKRHFERN